MQLRQRTVAAICLILTIPLIPISVISIGRDWLVPMTIITSIAYFLALMLFIDDFDRSPTTFLLGFLFLLVGLALGSIAWAMTVFSGPGHLFG